VSDSSVQGGLQSPLGQSDGHSFSIRVSDCPTDPEAIARLRAMPLEMFARDGQPLEVRVPRP
jgi:hypothetical protein